MSQNVYECLFIFDSNKYARDAARVSGSATEMVQQIDGEVLADRLWVEQKLAYPIQGHRKGTYWLTYFRAASDKLTAFNRLCQLNEAVLRHMVVRVEPRLVVLPDDPVMARTGQLHALRTAVASRASASSGSS